MYTWKLDVLFHVIDPSKKVSLSTATLLVLLKKKMKGVEKNYAKKFKTLSEIPGFQKVWKPGKEPENTMFNTHCM